MTAQEEVWADTTDEDNRMQAAPPPSRSEVLKWADVAMYQRQAIVSGDEPMKPRVTIINMTTEPLRTMAAASDLYKGEVHHSPYEMGIDDSLAWLGDMTKTKLQAPLEFIDIHFLFEGVSRAFTHQLVRQRTAVYIQESMRFSVAANGQHEVRVPPYLEDLPEDDPQRVVWDRAVASITWAYKNLIDSGVPAEDARGLLPTNIGTRVHYKTNLRGLAEHAGMRLCSQAQDEWKEVWDGIIQAILEYGPVSERWQQRAIASLFRPICFTTGKCEFMAETDRWCRIRDRVEEHHRNGEAPVTWLDIDPHECLRPGAARLSPQMAEHLKKQEEDNA